MTGRKTIVLASYINQMRWNLAVYQFCRLKDMKGRRGVGGLLGQAFPRGFLIKFGGGYGAFLVWGDGPLLVGKRRGRRKEQAGKTEQKPK